MKNKKTAKFSKFATSKLAPKNLNAVKGGLMCTCGTFSMCHIDGATDSDAV